jgi:putative transposase
MHASLRQRVRLRINRNPQPSAAIVDSQSLKTTGVGGKERDYEAAKKVKGRKRHLLVDTQGLVIGARLHSAQIQEREGIKLLLDIAARDRLPQRLSHLWLDAGYTGEQKGALGAGGYRIAAKNSNTPDNSTGNTGIRCAKDD